MAETRENVQSESAWDVSPTEAREIQDRLRCQVSLRNRLGNLQLVAGVDISVKRGQARAAVVILNLDDLKVVDVALAEQRVRFPYVPGLLTFREAPSIIAAYEKLTVSPDLLLFDGQGYAHPRRCGLASHMGVLLDKPSIGCAKTRYIGTYDEPAEEAGCYTDLWDGEDLIGAVLRTRTKVKPMFISPGHRIDFETTVNLALECCNGFRLPEPTRLAHHAAGGKQIQSLA